MYLRLSQSTVIQDRSVIGFFDLDNTSYSCHTRDFLKRAEGEGRLVSLTDDIPKAFVLCGKRGHNHIYFSQLSTATLKGRAEEGAWEGYA